jgi:hypothetical protein
MVAGALINLDKPKAARSHLARSLALAEEIGDVNTIVLAMTNSGYGAICAGDLTSARSLLDHALRLCRGPEPTTSTVGVLLLLAWEANVSDDEQRARTFLREAVGLLDVAPLGTNELETASAAGAQLALEDVLQEALEMLQGRERVP